MKRFLRFLRVIDARDIFVFIGFLLLYAGIAHFDPHIGMIVIGAVILVKGLVKWV